MNSIENQNLGAGWRDHIVLIIFINIFIKNVYIIGYKLPLVLQHVQQNLTRRLITMSIK